MRIALSLALLGAVLIAAGTLLMAAGGSVVAQESVTVSMGPATGPAGGGDQTGTATLTAQDGQTEVVISIDPSPDGAEVEQPAHIHEGTCENLGGIVHPLTNVVNGSSTTVVDASLNSLLSGTFAINVHKSGDELGVYVSCGDITAPAEGLPSAGGPPGSEGGVAPWTYLLVAAGVLALLSGGALALRRRGL